MTTHDLDALGRVALKHLERVVRIDSASDERSETVPSTPGQARLADDVGAFFAELGATVERDDFANVIATLPGRGAGVGQSPIALMIHLDTARGTHPVEALNVHPAWAGDRVPYPDNARLQVTVENYPATRVYTAQDLVFGTGKAPFGLDDKLGLTHMMTLARLLHEDPEAPHPPILFIGRPDEEIGREDALLGLAKTLADRGVDTGYTVDGLLPFEVNVENFNAAGGAMDWPTEPLTPPPGTRAVEVTLNGVNTHGATAHAEGSRSATRFAVELMQRLRAAHHQGVKPVHWAGDPLRDCDATVTFWLPPGPEGEAAMVALVQMVDQVVVPHLPRGASAHVTAPQAAKAPGEGAILRALNAVEAVIQNTTVIPVLPEDSSGREGYTAPYRIAHTEKGVRLDLRIRDFTEEGLEARKAAALALIPAGATGHVFDQYSNMAPRLAHRADMVTWAMEAAEQVGAQAEKLPIRGGTGVDPFLDAGVAVANLGTGYFAPESEKEFTTLQLMARHALWLKALVGRIALSRAG